MELIYIFNDGATDEIVEAVIKVVQSRIQGSVLPTTSLIDPDDGFESRRIILSIPDNARNNSDTIFNLGGFVGSIEENITAAYHNASRLLILTEN